MLLDQYGRELEPTPKDVERLDTKIYSQPHDWTAQNWTPGMLAEAIYRANDGEFDYSSDVITQVLKEDDRIKGAMQQRRQGLTGLPLTWSQGGDKRRKSRIEKAIAEDWYQILPEQELTKIMEWGLYKFCWVQAKWVENSKGRRVPVLEAWNPRWSRFQPQDNTWYIHTREKGWTKLDFTKPAIASKWFLFTPFGQYQPWNEGLWRTLAWWALVKRYTRSDWARYSEVHGFPTWVIETPEGWTNVRDREKAAEQFVNLGRDKAVALPKGVIAKIVEAQSANWQGFQQLIDEANLAIVLTIMGQNLTSEVTKGAKASTVVHAEIARNLLQSDAETLSSFLRYGPLRWWTTINFGSGVEPPWAIWDTTPKTDEKTKAETGKINVEAAVAAKKAFPDFDEKFYLENGTVAWLPEGTGKTIAAAPKPEKGDSSAEKQKESAGDA